MFGLAHSGVTSHFGQVEGKARLDGAVNTATGTAVDQAGFAGTRVKSVKLELRYGVCSVRQPNILLALNEIAQR